MISGKGESPAEVVLEIGYQHEQTLGKGDVLHIHVHGVKKNSKSRNFVPVDNRPHYGYGVYVWR